MTLQSDSDWALARAGHVTASRIGDLMARNRARDGWGVSRANYMAELIAERLTGSVSPSYQSAEMARGVETEPLARAAYAFFRDQSVLPAEFVKHAAIAWAGATPDGFVGDAGLVEFKCPNTATHIETLLGGSIPAKYLLQMQWQMACAKRDWCDFVSFDPRMPERMRLFVRRLPRDDARIGELERAVETFLAEIEDTLLRLRKSYAEAEADALSRSVP